MKTVGQRGRRGISFLAAALDTPCNPITVEYDLGSGFRKFEVTDFCLHNLVGFFVEEYAVNFEQFSVEQ